METRSLKCTLTPEEISKLLTDAARMTVEDKAVCQSNIDAAAAKLKTAKSCLEALQSTIDAKLDIANNGWEIRGVECRWVTDRAAGIATLHRCDTDEEIECKHLPAQQTIDAVVTSTPSPRTTSVLADVRVDQCGQSPDGVPYRVQVCGHDSVIVEEPDGTTRRIQADEWPQWAPNPAIDEQEYIDAWMMAQGPDEPEDLMESTQVLIGYLTSEPMRIAEIRAAVGDALTEDQVAAALAEACVRCKVVKEGKARGTTYRLA